MKTEILSPLEKITIPKDVNRLVKTSSTCCGGPPTHNGDACCQLDEQKKGEGEEGCGCNNSEKSGTKTSCC